MRYASILLLILFVVACDDSKPSGDPAVPAETNGATSTNAGSTATQPEAVPETPQHVAYDFVDNRHLAHLFDANGALTMDMGTSGALKYIQGRWNSTWHADRRDADTTYAYVRGVGASIRFPLVSTQHFETAGGKTEGWKLSVRLKPVGNQRCDLFLRSTNGEEKKFTSLNKIVDGWETYTVSIPDGLEIGQEHTLRLHFSRSKDVAGVRSAAAIDWIKIGPGDLALPHSLPTTTAKQWDLPAGTGLAWYSMPGKDMTLRAAQTGSPSVTIRGATPLKVETADAQITANLSAHSWKPVRFEVSAGTTPATLKDLRLTAEIAESKKQETKPQYVLVWIIDTLRADHLKLYNPSTEVQTPNLDELGKRSAVFTSATVQGNSSLPSSASVFTSAYAPKHKLVTEKDRLPKSATVFGEAFKKLGWTTALFSSNGYVSNKWGFARGMDIEVNPIRESRPSDVEFLWAESKTWLEKQVAENKEKSILLYMNPVDPHVPYDPPAEQLKNYTDRTGKLGKVSPRGTGQLLHDMAKGGIKLNKEEATYMHDLYQGEITYNDVWLGHVIADLKTMGILDKTMIVITSDHGEEFDEYGRYGHGISVNQELIDVPFIVFYEPWTADGMTIPYDVETIDMLPTVLGAAGAEMPASAQGSNLSELILSKQNRHPRPAFSYHNSFLRSARLGAWKYQLFHGDKDPLYELGQPKTNEPQDGEDVGDAKPIPRRMMRDLMAFQVGFDKTRRKSVDGFPNNHSAEFAKTLDGTP